MKHSIAPKKTDPLVVAPSKGMRVPVHLFVDPRVEPGPEAVHELQLLARTEGLHHPIVAMPDVHTKGRNPAPTGIVLVTRDRLVPFAVDKGINCGMRMVRTELSAKDCTDSVLDALYEEIQRRIPIQPHKSNVLRKKDVRQALAGGGAWATKHLGLPETELDWIERRGSMFANDSVDPDEIARAVPAAALKKARRAFGALGAGNHFLELQEIVEILDPQKARLLGLEKGKTIFMMHTGSGAVGSMVMRYYTTHGRPEARGDRLQLELDKLRFHLGSDMSPRDVAFLWKYLYAHRKFFTIPADSREGRRFVRSLYAAANFGYANRMAITEALRGAVRHTFADPGLQMPLLFDCSHVGIQDEEHAGERVWVHRHGANVALPPSRCAGHPVFGQTGQPIPIPGSMGADSFIGVGVEGNARTYHSANHGAGRLFDKPEAVQHFDEKGVVEEMAERRIRLYRAGTMNIAEQAPGSFKDIDAVLQVMSDLEIAQPVVRVRPLATLKG